jgi:transposase-like protein
MRCPDCGRFARYDAYHGRYVCDGCERTVPVAKTERTPATRKVKLAPGQAIGSALVRKPKR